MLACRCVSVYILKKDTHTYTHTVCISVCVFLHVSMRQCDLWVAVLQLRQVWLWHCFLYSADIETQEVFDPTLSAVVNNKVLWDAAISDLAKPWKTNELFIKTKWIIAFVAMWSWSLQIPVVMVLLSSANRQGCGFYAPLLLKKHFYSALEYMFGGFFKIPNDIFVFTSVFFSILGECVFWVPEVIMMAC